MQLSAFPAAHSSSKSCAARTRSGIDDAGTPSKRRIVPTTGRRSIYASFDVYPSAKGAATHIEHMAGTLFDDVGGGTLLCLADDTLPLHQQEGDREIVRVPSTAPNLLQRALRFGDRAAALAHDLGDDLKVVHFRDPFSGLPLLDEMRPGVRSLYEVNGLPSIELPARRPHLTSTTIAMLRDLEDRCLQRADVVIVPAQAIADALVGRGVAAKKIIVIRNGADAPPMAERPPTAPRRYFLYFGAVQPWQGVDTALRAFARLTERPEYDDVDLVVIASTRPRTTKPLQRLAHQLGLGDRVHFEHRLDKPTLAGWVRHAEATLAPLTECARNLEQGCCPLKILESLAAEVPVLASDLPVVRELLTPDEHATLLPPERPGVWTRAMLQVLEQPTRFRAMGRAGAAEHVAEHLTWGHTKTAYADVLRDLLHADGA